jgi:hypothetical protein
MFRSSDSCDSAICGSRSFPRSPATSVSYRCSGALLRAVELLYIPLTVSYRFFTPVLLSGCIQTQVAGWQSSPATGCLVGGTFPRGSGHSISLTQPFEAINTALVLGCLGQWRVRVAGWHLHPLSVSARASHHLWPKSHCFPYQEVMKGTVLR